MIAKKKRPALSGGSAFFLGCCSMDSWGFLGMGFLAGFWFDKIFGVE